MFKPSPQQADFFNWITNGSGSCVIEAVAGSGKTTTTIEGLKYMKGTIFFGAYNKKIAEEIKAKAPQKTGLNISTIHAAGLNAWKKVAPKAQIDSNKCRNIYRTSFNNPDLFKLEGSVLNLVSFAKQAAIGVGCHSDDDSVLYNLIDHFNVDCFDKEEVVVDITKQILTMSVNLDTKIIDFDDMIYAPLIHNVKTTEYDWVIVDEAADTNKSRRLLMLLMLKTGGRLVAVGDRKQNIYGFTGTDHDSLDQIKESVNAIELPLNVSYRCPKAVVKEAQKYVSHIQAHESAIEGSVQNFSGDLFSQVKVGDAILSRFNKPLIDLVYGFIGKGIACKIEGKEIGASMKTLVRRYKSKSFSVLIDRLNEYSDRESTKLRIKEKESQAMAIQDKVSCIKIIINRVQSINPKADPIESTVAEIEKIFEDAIGDNIITLTSIHKSKGREFDRVFWLQTGPSKWARKDWEVQTEVNLCYVAVTRAKRELYYVDYPLK